MLDFGSRMAQKDDHIEEDDLFSTVAEIPENSADIVPEPADPEVLESDGPVAEDVAAVKVETETDPAPKEESAPVRFSFMRKSKHHNDNEFEKIDTCKILRNARVSMGLSFDQVEAETQIRSRYLEALEDGDFDELPQQVYVLAYLRKLCALYRISPQDEEVLIKPWRQVTREVPENLPVIQDDDSENSKALRRLEFVLLAGGAIIVVGIVAFLVILAVSFFKGDKPETPKFDNTMLLELQEAPQLATPPASPVKSKR